MIRNKVRSFPYLLTLFFIWASLQQCQARDPDYHKDALLQLERRCIQDVKEFSRSWPGVIGFAAYDLKEKRYFGWNDKVRFPQASSIKIPILIYTLRLVDRKKLDLKKVFTIPKSYYVGGGGTFKTEFQEKFRSGKNSIRKSLRQILHAMISRSDNIATNFIIDRIGMQSVNQMLKKYDLDDIVLQRKMMDLSAVKNNRENLGSPANMLRLMVLLYEGKLLSPKSTTFAISTLKTVDKYFRQVIPLEIEVASKSGFVPGSFSETGIVFYPGRHFVLSVMTSFNDLKPEFNPVSEITSIVLAHFRKVAKYNRYGHSPQGYRKKKP